MAQGWTRGPGDELWNLFLGTASARGPDFFRELARLLARALGVSHAVVSEVGGCPPMLHALAVWADGRWDDPPADALEGTPCALVVEGGATVLRESGVREQFGAAGLLGAWNIESYLGVPLRASSGAILGALCVMDHAALRDATRARAVLEQLAERAAAELERIQGQRALEEQRAFLRQVLDINPNFVFAKDRAGRFTLVNQAVAEAYGTTIDGLIGKTDADFNPNAEEVAFFRKMDLEVMDSGQERRIPEEPVTEASGRVRWVQTIKRPIAGPDGRAHQVLGVATDITELRRAREELLQRQMAERRQVQEQLERVQDELVRHTRLAAIGQIAASIAHELRNPLGAIQNAVFLLRRQIAGASEKTLASLDIVAQEVRAADRIIGDLLEMTRARTPRKEQVDLGAALERAFEDVRGEARLGLRLDLAPAPFFLAADPAQLRQVLTNLLNNALQAMPEGGAITVHARHAGDVDEVLVEDEGPGVPQAERERIFEPLFTTKAKGTGLGLTICRQIVEQHGGTIELAPSTHGAALRLRFPAVPAVAD